MTQTTVQIGRRNRLSVCKDVDFGLFLDGGDPKHHGLGNILLPMRYVPKGSKIGDTLDVFIYLDSEDRIIATTEHPKAMVGECALLNVSSITRHGVFLDWGLSKDLLLPFNEQITRMQEGKSYIVYLYCDDAGRIAASARLNDFIADECDGRFKVGQEVSLFNAAKTDLGHKMIINNTHWGLLHKQELVRELRRGERMTGFIKHIRDDGRIDLALFQKQSEKRDDVAELVLSALERAGGFLPFSDKSSPDAIKATFGISKVLFKKAIGTLYKQKEITIKPDGIRLT